MAIRPPMRESKTADRHEVKITIAVPSTYGQSDRVTDETHQRRAREVMTQLSDWFGGYTGIAGSGGWVTDEKKLVREPVLVVESYAKEEDYLKHRTDLAKYARSLARRWKQDAIALGFEDDLYFVSAPKKRKKRA